MSLQQLIQDMRTTTIEFAKEKGIILFHCYECDKPMVEDADFCSTECEVIFAEHNPRAIRYCPCGNAQIRERFCSKQCKETYTCSSCDGALGDTPHETNDGEAICQDCYESSIDYNF